MANIIRQRDNGGAVTQAGGEWDPYRAVRDMLRWDPFREMLPFSPAAEGGFIPHFDVRESKDAYTFKADMPGVKESDLEISFTGNRLTVSGKREAEHRDEQDTYYAYERSYGTFTRAFTLPDGADPEHARAELKEGVLTLVVPKRPELQPRKITVGARPGAKT
jgi:HSP20 family protein